MASVSYYRSPGHIRSALPSVPAPLGPEEITLPHSSPIPAAQVELAKPWIEVRAEQSIHILWNTGAHNFTPNNGK